MEEFTLQYLNPDQKVENRISISLAWAITDIGISLDQFDYKNWKYSFIVSARIMGLLGTDRSTAINHQVLYEVFKSNRYTKDLIKDNDSLYIPLQTNRILQEKLKEYFVKFIKRPYGIEIIYYWLQGKEDNPDMTEEDLNLLLARQEEKHISLHIINNIHLAQKYKLDQSYIIIATQDQLEKLYSMIILWSQKEQP